MQVFRISLQKYAHDLSGKGAELNGGRWNSKGVAILYTAESRALATAEMAVHLPFNIIPKDYQLITLSFPDNLKIEELKDIPDDCDSLPHAESTQKIGDEFVLKAKTAILKVPSVVVKGDFNYLFNPAHKDFERLKIEAVETFSFDSRFFMK